MNALTKLQMRMSQLHYFGASHGDGMNVMALPEEQVLFTADLVVPKRVAFMFMPDFSPHDDWLGMNGARIMLEMMMGY